MCNNQDVGLLENAREQEVRLYMREDGTRLQQVYRQEGIIDLMLALI